MSSLSVLLVCCCYFVAVIADHNDTITALERLIHKTNKNIEETERAYEAKRKEVVAVKKLCLEDIGTLKLREKAENDEFKKDIDVLKSLKAEFIVIEAEQLHTNILTIKEKNIFKKMKFELTLTLSYTNFLKERRQSNKYSICSELMNSRSELSARNGEATVMILQNERNLANNKLEQGRRTEHSAARNQRSLQKGNRGPESGSGDIEQGHREGQGEHQQTEVLARYREGQTERYHERTGLCG